MSSSECISWIDMQCSYFHFTPNKANTLFVWMWFKMSEIAYICINCNYTNSLGISFSLLFPSDQSCASNSVQSTICYPYLYLYLLFHCVWLTYVFIQPNIKLHSPFTVCLFWTVQYESIGCSKLFMITISHTYLFIQRQWTFVGPGVPFWSIFARTTPPRFTVSRELSSYKIGCPFMSWLLPMNYIILECCNMTQWSNVVWQ